jgi:MFS family permease
MTEPRLTLKSRINELIPADRTIRIMSLSSLINTFGNGLFMTIEVVYFTQIVGISVAKLAIALSIAGGVSMLFSIPAGHLADRIGPRDTAAIAYVVEGIATFALLFTRNYSAFLVLNILVGITGTIGQTLRMATIAKIGNPEDKIKTRAFIRSVVNLGIGLGTLCAGVALHLNTATSYQVMLAIDAVTFLIAAYIFHKLPFVAPTVNRSEPISFIALKDRRFLGATALNSVMSLHFVLQNVAIPLWIIRETNAPRWWISVVMVVNTVAVILFQMRASKGSGDLNQGAKLYMRAGFAIAISCILYAFSARIPTVAACSLLILAMMVHVFGELIGSAGSWSIGFGLAQQEHQGQYQGVYSLSWGLGGTLGPAFVTALAIGLGRSGWMILAALFAMNGVLMHKLVTGNWLTSIPVLSEPVEAS